MKITSAKWHEPVLIVDKDGESRQIPNHYHRFKWPRSHICDDECDRNFTWGYGGSGPHELAWSILYELYGEEIADMYGQRFKWDMLSELDQDGALELDLAEINRWLEKSRIKLG